MCDVHWCVTVDYWQIANDNIANQIHGFTVDYGKFILKGVILHVYQALNVQYVQYHSERSERSYFVAPAGSEEAPLDTPRVYIQEQRIFVENLRNVLVVGESFSIWLK